MAVAVLQQRYTPAESVQANTRAHPLSNVMGALVVWAVCLEDGEQFIVEWRDPVLSYANAVIIYSRVLVFFLSLSFSFYSTPFTIHHSFKPWGIIFAERFIFSLPLDGWRRAHTQSFLLNKNAIKSGLAKVE